jgi:hypothetical protein
MSNFRPEKLHVDFPLNWKDDPNPLPRCYTLTHSDQTGDLFLTIDRQFDHQQISGLYTKLMRDEVLGEWKDDSGLSLHIYLHVSGGLVLGPAKWRYGIFKQHLPMTLEAICYGDKVFAKNHPDAPIIVHFLARQARFNAVQNWGIIKDSII